MLPASSCPNWIRGGSCLRSSVRVVNDALASGAPMSALVSIVLFVIGVVLAVWATERLLEGLVGVSVALRLSAFAVGAVLSGFEDENIAVGLAAGARGTAPVAL